MIAVVGFGLMLLALPGAARSRLRRMGPSIESRMSAWSLAVGLGLVGIGLVSMSVTLFEGVGAHRLAAMCRRLIHDVLAGGHFGGAVAAFFLAFLSVRAVIGWRRLRRLQQAAVIEPWVGHHDWRGNYELVVVPSADFVALTVGGVARQVVVSDGLVKALSDDELRMVVRHELAHLRRRHHTYLAIAAVVDSILGWLPVVRSSTRVLRLAVERSADEEAAGDDPAARRALYSALAAATRCLHQPGIAGFGGVEMVFERLKALESKPSTSRSRWSYVAVGCVASAAASLWLVSMLLVGVSVLSVEICHY